MAGVVGIVVIFVAVFGGYILAGGKMGIILASLPFELMIIFGSAIGAFILSNGMHVAKQVLSDLKMAFKGYRWEAEDYRDVLCLLYSLLKLRRDNPIDLERHIEAPEESSLFSTYPKIQRDPVATALICDTLRAASLNYDDPHQVEAVLEKRIEQSLAHSSHSSHALQVMADGLPALGIVAAVLGVIKTMSSIDQPPEILGKMIGGALVGTFLGVFLAYGFVAPLAARIKAVIEGDSHFYQVIKDVLVSSLHQHSAAICVEVGRQSVADEMRPEYSEVEQCLKGLKANAA